MFCKRIPRGHLGAIGPEHSSELKESGIVGRDPAKRRRSAPKQSAAPAAAPGRHPEPRPRGNGLRPRLRMAYTAIREWLIRAFTAYAAGAPEGLRITWLKDSNVL